LREIRSVKNVLCVPPYLGDVLPAWAGEEVMGRWGEELGRDGEMESENEKRRGMKSGVCVPMDV
jgi:hypothetical protein